MAFRLTNSEPTFSNSHRLKEFEHVRDEIKNVAETILRKIENSHLNTENWKTEKNPPKMLQCEEHIFFINLHTGPPKQMVKQKKKKKKKKKKKI